MKWNYVYPDFEYNRPIDFCGDWIHAIFTLCNKSERKAFAGKCKTLFANYSTTKIIIGIILTVLVDLFTIAFSLVVMVVYYVTLPIRFIADVFCAIYANFIDKFWG